MSSGLDNIGDLLDDPNYKAWMRGGGGGGGGVHGGTGPGGGGGFYSYNGTPSGVGMSSTDPATGMPRRRRLPIQHPGTARLAASYGVQPAFDESGGHAAPISPLAGAAPAGRGATPATGSGNPTWDYLVSSGRSPFAGNGSPRRNPIGPGTGGAPSAPRVPVGGNTGPREFDPNNPWGHMTGNTDTSPEGLLARLLGAGGQAGVFDPNGGQILRSMEDAGRSTIDNWERGTANELSALGLDDPSLYTAMLTGERADQGRALTNAMTHARGNWANSNADYIRSLLSGAVGQQWNHYNTQYAHSLQDDGGTDWGGLLGGIGSIAGAFF